MKDKHETCGCGNCGCSGGGCCSSEHECSCHPISEVEKPLNIKIKKRKTSK